MGTVCRDRFHLYTLQKCALNCVWSPETGSCYGIDHHPWCLPSSVDCPTVIAHFSLFRCLPCIKVISSFKFSPKKQSLITKGSFLPYLILPIDYLSHSHFVPSCCIVYTCYLTYTDNDGHHLCGISLHADFLPLSYHLLSLIFRPITLPIHLLIPTIALNLVPSKLPTYLRP
jgi:hypothetical protein